MHGPPTQALPIIMTTLPSSNLAAGVQCLGICAVARGFTSGKGRQQSRQEPLPDGALLTPLLTPSAQRRLRQQLCCQPWLHCWDLWKGPGTSPVKKYSSETT